MIVLFLVGSGFSFLALFILFAEMQTRKGSVLVSGEVVGFQNSKTSLSSGAGFQTVARYQNFDGLTYYSVSKSSSSFPMDTVGDTVGVYVRKDDFAFSEIRSRLSFIFAGVLGGIGLLCLFIFFRSFHFDLFSVGSGAAVMALILRSVWKAKRSVPLSKSEWLQLKKKNATKTTYTEDEKDLIDWVPAESIATVFENAKTASQKAIPICALLTVLCGGSSVFFYQKMHSFLDHAKSTSGTVVDLVESRSKDTTTYAPIVEFINPISKTSQRFRHSVSSSPPSYSVGEPVSVLYDPNNPSDARIDSGIWNYLLSIILGVASCLFLFFTLNAQSKYQQYANPHRRRQSSMPRRPPRSA